MRTVIFITHKLEEVMEAAQTVTVMRAGRVVGTMPVGETDAPSLAEMMVGRSIETVSRGGRGTMGETVLEVQNLSLRSRKGQDLLSGITFAVREGELFGIAGVDGNGQDELFEVLIGLRPASAGRVRFMGRDITHSPTKERLKLGLLEEEAGQEYTSTRPANGLPETCFSKSLRR